MKSNFLFATIRCHARRPLAGLTVVAAFISLQPASAIPLTVNLGSAANFAVLAGAGITVTGPTTINGDIGSYVTTSMTGLENVTLNGANHGGDAITQLAKNDLTTAYNDAAGRAADVTYSGGFDLVGKTLPAGVYKDASSLFLSGILTLDAHGNSDAVWIFQIGSSLITASSSIIALIGGAQACHVFWQVGSSATLGTGSTFIGNILALTDLTLNTGATVDGRVLAQNGAVTLDGNSISKSICSGEVGVTSVPDGGNTLLLLSAGIATLLVFKYNQAGDGN